MPEISGFSAFLIGLAGGVHCVGMCGGIVTALRAATPDQKNAFPFTLSYNFGRITSYTLAGALAGGLGQLTTAVLPYAAIGLSLFSAIMLACLALYLGQWWQGLRHLEQAGGKLWRHIQPLSVRFIPFKTPWHALPYGFIWGWLPCGLVYSTLTWSLTAGTALDGAMLMLCFGLGTLPTLLAASLGASYLVMAFKHPKFRQVIALSLFIYAFFLIYRIMGSISAL
ncbi:sulfite exporter TauE/SafE family protein [Alteromonas halophila]|uniref:Cytochrome biogenesis protein n=1 Tax=Alteromonas halophila TaxID=516698 RepID=A0A918MZE3_9ALTE|nr:sulfite exporter TauE/SafE family protein [Alteromonas halophila]GGW88689.1 cytochrome biogenesis protein [Alteromonas halophila]